MVELRAVFHQEATNAGELISLSGQHHHIEVEIGEVLARKLKTRVVGVINVDHTRKLVGHALLQSLDRVGVLVRLSGGVVVRSHASPLLIHTCQPRSAGIVCRKERGNANAPRGPSRNLTPRPTFGTPVVFPRSREWSWDAVANKPHDERVRAMDELTVIGAENGALVVVAADGTRFRVPITEALHTALRQNRPAAPAAHRVGPREVQALIREGLTAAQVASQTGESLEYVQRFEGPVLAEREYVVTAARAVAVALASDSDAGTAGTFGSAIDYRLRALGARDIRWESRKADTHWLVSISFLDGETARTAVWTFDPKKATLVPANHEAQSLSQQGDAPAPIIPRLRAVPAEPGNNGRFDSGAFAPASDLGRAAASLERGERPIARIAEGDTADTRDVGNTADLLEALRRRRGEREAAPTEEWESSRAAHPSTGSIRIVDVPIDPALMRDDNDNENDGIDDPIDVDAIIDDASFTGIDTPPSPATPTKPARRGRATMPSWDEIVFGARPDDDPA